jgi:hypothetical protein
MAFKKAQTRQLVDPYEILEVPDSIPRDRWDRPLIEQPDGGNAIAYTRASTLGKAIEDTYHLNKWIIRAVVLGMSRRSDLVALAAAIPENEGEHRKPLDEIGDKAKDAGGGDTGANIGTALHKLSERRDAGEDLSYLPPELMDAMDAYAKFMALFKVLATETFVVCDPLQTAGSFDRVVMLLVDLHGVQNRDGKMVEFTIPAGTVLVLDLKTGKYSSAKYWGPTYGVQQTVYACGEPYELGVGRRSWESILGEGLRPSTEWALILHVPSDSPKDAGLVLVDLERGAAMASLAIDNRAARKDKALLTEVYPVENQAVPEPRNWHAPGDVHASVDVGYPPPDAVPAQAEAPAVEQAPQVVEHGGRYFPVGLVEAISAAPDRAALDGLWTEYQDVWTDEHTAAVQARLVELDAQAAKPAQVVQLDLIAKLRAAPDEAALNALWEANQAVWDEDCTRMAKARSKELQAGVAG